MRHFVRSLSARSGGASPYSVKYRSRPTGRSDRLHADGLALAKTPKMIRAVFYEGLDIQGWDVEKTFAPYPRIL